MEYNFEELKKRLEDVPEDVQRAVASTDVFESLEKIGKDHNIHVDSLGELVEETTLVMLGVTHPNEYVSHLVKRMEIDKEKAKEIADDVNEQVFKSIRESLKKIHELKQEGEETSDKETPVESKEEYRVPRPKRGEEETPPSPNKEPSTPQEAPVINPQGEEPFDPRKEETAPPKPSAQPQEITPQQPKKEGEESTERTKIFPDTPKDTPEKEEGVSEEKINHEEDAPKEPETPKKSEEGSVAESNLQGPTRGAKEEVPLSPPKKDDGEEGQKREERGYEADPYREPIE